MNLDRELSGYLFNFSAPQHNPDYEISVNGLSIEEWKNTERMRAEYMVNAFRHFRNEKTYYAAAAASCFRACSDYEQSIIYSHYALDIMLLHKQCGDDWEELWALEKLQEMWCPKMIESAWHSSGKGGKTQWQKSVSTGSKYMSCCIVNLSVNMQKRVVRRKNRMCCYWGIAGLAMKK